MSADQTGPQSTSAPPQHLSLKGLTLLPSQALGAFRVVPVAREVSREDLRLASVESKRRAIVKLNKRDAYVGYIPHGLVLTWGERAGDKTLLGGVLSEAKKELSPKNQPFSLVDKLIKREDKHALRFLPLHVALEGFLALGFGGPEIAWKEYSKATLKYGLSPRFESVVSAAAMASYRETLSMFEIAEGQVGSLIFCQDALVSAFVLSHPEDYQALHMSLLSDFICEQLYHYALLPTQAQANEVQLKGEGVTSLAELERALDEGCRALEANSSFMSDRVFQTELEYQQLYRVHDFTFYRFLSDMQANRDNHIGETIIDDSGCVQYLKTYRLSTAQAKRGYLLKHLKEHDWHLDRTAQALNTDRSTLIARLKSAGFDHLLAI